MGVDDENLGPLRREGNVYGGCRGGGQIHVQPGAVVEVQAPGHLIALGAGGHQGAGDDVLRRGSGLGRRLADVVVILGGLPGGQIGGGGRGAVQMPGHGVPIPRSRRLVHHQAGPAAQAGQGTVVLRYLSQFCGEGGGDKAGVLPQTAEGIGGGASPLHTSRAHTARVARKRARLRLEQAAPLNSGLHSSSSFTSDVPLGADMDLYAPHRGNMPEGLS